MKLHVKNMVCHRCILAVEDILQSETIPVHNVIYGEIQLPNKLTQDQQERLAIRFNSVGFELIDSRSAQLIENVKLLVIKRARNEISEGDNKLKLSHYLSDQVNYEYTYLSSLFSSVEGRTIENYFIEQRIEKVKELLSYGQMTLSQIAFELDFSDGAHLSKQFKKITGLTPSNYKGEGLVPRISLDKI